MGSGPKVKKSFKKFAKKHLATAIETRRKTAQSKKEKKERLERKKVREAKAAEREEKEHIDQLERLKETDPDFYSFLEDEDPTLLQFGKEDMDVVDEEDGSDAETDRDDEDDEDDEDGEDNDEEGDEEDDGEDAGVRAEREDYRKRIGRAELQELLRAEATEDSIARCIDAFVSAARALGYKLKENPTLPTTRRFEDPDLVKEALVSLSQHASRHVGVLLSARGAIKSVRCRHLVRRLLLAVTAVVAEGTIDVTLTTGLLNALVPFVPVLHHVKGLTKTVLRAALLLCSAPEETVRVAAYLVVRAVATRATGTRSMYQSAAFKGIFLALIRTAHLYSVHNQTAVAFLINCVVDLYGTDLEAAYQHTFVYLRQLAIYLRAALQQQSQSNVRAVVNWQFINALRVWGAVVSIYGAPDQLGPLVHPVVQIATCLMDLFSSPRMFPMHLQIIEVLNRVAGRADAIYIPVVPYLLRILSSPSVALGRVAGAGAPGKAKRRAGGGDAVELPFTIRVKKTQMRSPAYHEAVWAEALYLLTEHLATHSNTVGFPETFWAVESTLRKLRADVKVPRISGQLATLLKHMQAVSRNITARRDQANFGPCDLAAVRAFEDDLARQTNPLVAYQRSLRQQRVEAFAARQRSATEERLTLERATAKKGDKAGSAIGRKRRRDEENDDADDAD